MVACLLLRLRFAGQNPAEDVGVLRTTSLGEEVKPPVPSPKFMACKETYESERDVL
jgi:hypothetical protein